MSYDVSLEGAGPVKRISEGGTQVLGGSTEAELNITYNYSEVYNLLGFNISQLNGQKAGDWIPELDALVSRLGTKQFTDYWAPTPGNAGYALSILLEWAKQYPDAIFRVS